MRRKRPSVAERQLALLRGHPASFPRPTLFERMSAAQREPGPALPPRSAVHARAVELVALARRAEEFSGDGPAADLALALRQFERMRAILGEARDG